MQPKTTFIATVLNEEKSIGLFLESLFLQTFLPDEIIIVDGGSSDNTLSVISNFPLVSRPAKGGKFPIFNNIIKIITKKGNRSVGRNEAIKQSKNEIILCSDAGCILDKEWVRKITEPFRMEQETQVVAGFYSSITDSIFEKCLVPYVLVMPDKVKGNNFLPSTRSVAFKKYVWEKLGGFREDLSDNEDYYFARKLKEKEINIKFVRDAVVYWIPRKNLYQAIIMFYRFAKGDVESGIIRPKAILIFVRYLFGILLIINLLLNPSKNISTLTITVALIYIFWSINKNYK
ncbi:glycosyltransferase, partial [Candidatus Parcubacteria bacterium]